LDDRQKRLEELFRDVRKVARVSHPYSMPTSISTCLLPGD